MITITETLYKKMPDDIKACFNQLPNPSSEEVRECFPETKSVVRISEDKDEQQNTWSLGRTGTTPRGHNDSGNASRFFKSIIYQAKASKSERDKGCDGLEENARIDYGGFHSEKGLITNGRNPENRQPIKNNHPTVKPLDLMEYLITMVTPKNGTVLDPFMGSGTTGVAAVNLNRNFIGIELDAGYFEIAKKRIDSIKQINQLELFAI